MWSSINVKKINLAVVLRIEQQDRQEIKRGDQIP